MQYTYYRVDSSKLTLAELWRSYKNPLEFVIAVVCKLFGASIAPKFGIACTDRLVRVLAAADDGTTSRPRPWLTRLEWACWFTLMFGIYLTTKEHANRAQFVFRLSLVGVGLVGAILFQVARLLRGKS
jgi:hypothetical protein